MESFKIKLGEPFHIKVITKSKEEKIFIKNDIINVKVRAIPENGKANLAVINLLSEKFDIAKSRIKIINGLSSSLKKVCII